MTTPPIWTLPLLALVLGACEDPGGLDDLPDLAEGESEGDTGELPVLPAISAATRKHRCDAIKAVAGARGITNPLVIAGVAQHETHLVQCLSEWPIHCAGPHSSDCGGPVLAGSGDGPCAHQQGGLGMFQFDAGTYAQTLAHYGHGVLGVAGNVEAGIEVIIHKLRVCQHTRDIATSDAAAIELINRARPGTPEYEAYMSTMASCYNGCQPHYTSCSHQGMRSKYKAGVQDLLDALGDDYWNDVGDDAPTPASSERIGTNADGRLELFALGTDGAIVHRWQPAPSHAFGAWASLGGALASPPVVGTSADGRLEIFAIAPDGAVHHRWQEGSGHWSAAWDSLGSVDRGFVGEAFVAANADGRLEVFARTPDGRVWSKWQAGANAAFVGDWFAHGGDAASDPIVAANRDGRLEVFARGSDGSLRHRWQQEPSGSFDAWADLGGALAGDPAIGTNADGRLEVFHVGLDGALRHRWQNAGAGWAPDWASHGGSTFVGTPVVGSNLDGRMEIVARSADGRLWHTWQTEANAPLADGWAQFGEDAAGDAQIARNADGRLEVFVLRDDGRVWHRWQVEPNAGWAAWEAFDGAIAAF